MMYVSRTLGAAVVVLLVVTLVSVAPVSATYQERPLVSVAVVPPLYVYLVEILGDGYVYVFSPIPPGVDPHTYEGTPQDIQKALSADIVVVDVLGHLPISSKLVEAARASGKMYIVLFDRLLERGWEPLKKPSGALDLHFGFDENATIVSLEIIRDEILSVLRQKVSPDVFERVSRDINTSTRDLIEVIRDIYGFARSRVSGLGGVALYSSVSLYLARSLGIDPVHVFLEEPEAEPTPRDIEALVASGARCILVLQGVEEYSDRILSVLEGRGVRPVVVNIREAIRGGVPYLVPVLVADRLRSQCGQQTLSTAPVEAHSVYSDPVFIAVVAYSVLSTAALAYLVATRRRWSL